MFQYYQSLTNRPKSLNFYTMRIETGGCGPNRTLGLSWGLIWCPTTADCLHSKTNRNTTSVSIKSITNLKGFNGKELDSEGMDGGGSTYDYGFRIYSAQLCRFLSVDPLTASFPWYTPFQFAGNKPICSLDLDGLEDIYYLKPLINGKESLLLRVFKNSTVGKYILKAFENLTAKDPADIVVFESNLPTNLAGFTSRIPNHIIKSHLKGTTDNVNQILEKFGLDKGQKKELDLLFKTIVSKCENRDVFLVALRKNTTARSEGSFTLAAEGAFNLGH